MTLRQSQKQIIPENVLEYVVVVGHVVSVVGDVAAAAAGDVVAAVDIGEEFGVVVDEEIHRLQRRHLQIVVAAADDGHPHIHDLWVWKCHWSWWGHHCQRRHDWTLRRVSC